VFWAGRGGAGERGRAFVGTETGARIGGRRRVGWRRQGYARFGPCGGQRGAAGPHPGRSARCADFAPLLGPRSAAELAARAMRAPLRHAAAIQTWSALARATSVLCCSPPRKSDRPHPAGRRTTASPGWFSPHRSAGRGWGGAPPSSRLAGGRAGAVALVDGPGARPPEARPADPKRARSARAAEGARAIRAADRVHPRRHHKKGGHPKVPVESSPLWTVQPSGELGRHNQNRWSGGRRTEPHIL